MRTHEQFVDNGPTWRFVGRGSTAFTLVRRNCLVQFESSALICGILGSVWRFG